ARQPLPATARQGIVEDHRQPRIGTEAFAAHARGEMHAAQIHCHRADRADAVEAERYRRILACGLERAEIVQDAGRRLAMYRPQPALAGQPAWQRRHVERLAPGLPHYLELQTLAPRMVDEPVAEFAVAQHDAGPGGR